jgi:hypothetical protein
VRPGSPLSNASRLGAALAAILLLCATSSTLAATPEETAKAREHFQKGQVNYELKEFQEALKQFKDAYRYVQDPVLLFNIAQCHFKLGQSQEALSFYRNYLRRAPQAPNRPEVERRIQEIERGPAASAPTAEAPPAPPPGIVPRPEPSPSAAPIVIAPPPSGTAPVRSAPVPPASSAASPASGPVPAPAASARAITPPPVASPPIDLLARPPEPPVAPSETPIYKRWWFWTGIGAVVTAGVITGVVVSRRGEVGNCMGIAPCIKVSGP